MQSLAVAGAVFVPDHQVDGYTAQAPISCRANQLLGDGQSGDIADSQQHDREVARYSLSPQARLSSLVGGDHARFRAQRKVGIKDGGGHVLVELGIRQGGIGLPQRHLAMCPGKVEHTI